MCGGNSSNIWNDIKWLCYIISWSYMLYHIIIMLYHITITISTNRSQRGLSNVNEVVRNLLIIIGWKTASNTPLCTPPVPPVGKYYGMYFWDRYVIIMDFYWRIYNVVDILRIFVSFINSILCNVINFLDWWGIWWSVSTYYGWVQVTKCDLCRNIIIGPDTLCYSTVSVSSQ